MNIKTPQILISEASKEIKTISAKEALSLSKENKCNLIDLREEGELNNSGTIDTNKDIVLFCAAGGRSALAAKTLNDMGFQNVSHIEGGFISMVEEGFKVKK